MPSDLALLCLLHPATAEKKGRVLSLLDQGKAYYHSPEGKCTTWCYFTPSSRKGAPLQMIPKDSKETIIGGMEIYTDKAALSTQLEAPFFKDFHAKVKAEGLYAKEEQLVAYYPVAGFVAREQTAKPFGGNMVMLAKFVCKEGERDKLVEILRVFAEWVKENEPGVLTYSVMIRPKEPNELLMFERYRDVKSFVAHGGSKEFRSMFKSTGPYVEGKQTTFSEWTELDNAFVGNVLGGVEVASKSKL